MVNTKKSKPIRLIPPLVLFLIGWLPATVWAEIDVRVDRNPVQEDESFAIQFSSQDADGDPDFSPLQNDFKILQTNQSRNLQLINGQMKQSVSWTLMLAPLHTGKIVIPSISFGSESSPKLQLEVKPATSAANGVSGDLFFVQVDSDTQTTYVQSQILVTVKLYLGSPNIMEPHLDELSVSDKDASIEKLNEDADYTKNVGGRNYRVIEKKYAIFPQTPGTLTINSLQFETRYIDERRALRYKQAKSKAMDITVKPIPSQFGSNYWLPAADVSLSESWSPALDQLKEGEPATRTLTLTASGASSNLLPPISQGSLTFAKLYPDQPALSNDTNGKGVVGKRVEKIAVIPSQSGRFTLPAIEIPWWNTKKHRMEYARIKARTINIAAAKNEQTRASPNTSPAVSPLAAASESASLPVITSTQAPLLAQTSDRWFYVSMVLAIFWIATIVAWLKSGKHEPGESLGNGGKEQRVQSTRRKLEKAIESAVAAGDLQKIKHLLVQWSVAVWGPRAPRSIGAMKKRSSAILADELEYLNNLLYGGDAPRHWDGKGLCVALKQYQDNSEGNKQDGLKPLYQNMQYN